MLFYTGALGPVLLFTIIVFFYKTAIVRMSYVAFYCFYFTMFLLEGMKGLTRPYVHVECCQNPSLVMHIVQYFFSNEIFMQEICSWKLLNEQLSVIKASKLGINITKIFNKNNINVPSPGWETLNKEFIEF